MTPEQQTLFGIDNQKLLEVERTVHEALNCKVSGTPDVPAVLAQVLQSGDEAIGLFGRLKTYCYGASPMPMPLRSEESSNAFAVRLRPNARMPPGRWCRSA